MKPWDGPAAIVMSDGDSVIAHLDRNGLRPMRYALTEEGVLILGSEAGMIDLEGMVISKTVSYTHLTLPTKRIV